MGYSLTPSEDRDYILLNVVDDFKAQDMMKYIVEAHALGKEMGINSYLVDVSKARNIDSITKNYYFAYSEIKLVEGIDSSAKVAALVSQGDHSHDFVETVLHNAGTPIKIFNDFVKAREYLQKK